MKSIDFSNLKFADNFGAEPTLHDLRAAIAEITYQSAATFEESRLPSKIYDSAGEVELTDVECDFLRRALSERGVKWFVQQPILAAIGNQ